MAKKIETLSLNETIELLREYGVPVSYQKLCAWIDSRSVPWAVSGEFKGETLRTIFKKPLLAWLDNLAEEVA